MSLSKESGGRSSNLILEKIRRHRWIAITALGATAWLSACGSASKSPVAITSNLSESFSPIPTPETSVTSSPNPTPEVTSSEESVIYGVSLPLSEQDALAIKNGEVAMYGKNNKIFIKRDLETIKSYYDPKACKCITVVEAQAQEACRQALIICSENIKKTFPDNYDSEHYGDLINYFIALQAPYQSLINHASTLQELPRGSVNQYIQLSDGSYVNTMSMLSMVGTAQDIKALGRTQIQSNINLYKSAIKTAKVPVLIYLYTQNLVIDQQRMHILNKEG